MKLQDYYIALRLYQKEKKLSDTMSVSLLELSDVLCCSSRNVKLLLKKMAFEGWLKWEPGRGRGKTSTLTFEKDCISSLTELFQTMLDKGELTAAIELLKENLSEDIKEELHQLLNAHFGYQEKESTSTKDVLKIPMTRKLSSLDPALVSVSSESHFVRQVYDTLIQYDEEEKCFKPHLAHEFDITEEGRVITFYLRKGVTFHNGKNMTSKDVDYSFRRLTDPECNSPCRWQTSLVKDVKCLGLYVIRFELKRKTRMFLHFISSLSMAVQPDDGAALVGTGPFSVASKTDDLLILEAYPYYFKERAWLDRIEIWRIPPQSKVSFHYELPELIDERGSDVDFLQVGCNYLTFNLNKKNIVQSRDFRNAVYHLYDIEQMINDLGGNRKLAATSLFPEKSLRHPPERKSLEAAKRYLIRSGYSGEVLTVSFFDMKNSGEDATWLKRRAEEIGLQLALHPFPLLDYYKKEVTAHSDMIIMGEMFENNLVLAFINFFKHQSSFVNRFLAGEDESRINSLVDRLMDEEDEGKQEEYLEEIERDLFENRLLLNSYHTYRKKHFPASLKNVSMNTFGWADFRKLWVKPFL
jgi:MarR-like DNA-binding transcriptional regulator SgrR of sgrS sRNA